MNRPAFALIGDDILPAEVLRNRKSDRTALVRIEGQERSVPKSCLYSSEADAATALAQMRRTKEYGDRKAAEPD